VSIQIRFDDNDNSQQVTPQKLPDLPTHLTESAYWKAHRKSKRNSYVIKLIKEDSDGGDPITYELLIEYINNCWYGLNWNKALKQYFTNPKELLPPGFTELGRGEPQPNKPRLLNIPPPIPPIGEPLQARTTFDIEIHSMLQGIAINPAQQSSPITQEPQLPSMNPVMTFPSSLPQPVIRPTPISQLTADSVIYDQ
jgi:hypothetical protein